MSSPFLAVFMVTYNHEKFIRKAIQSVLLQKTTFPIKLFIGEDCSTDHTAEICSYFKNEPEGIIELIINDKNLGPSKNAKQVYEACYASGAKYIAILEGDDYWTDPYKLQKQVDFLEANPDYGMVHTGANVVNNTNEVIFVSNESKPSGEVFTELLKRAFIITTTVCIRADIIRTLTNRIDKENLWYTMDYWTWAHCAMVSKVHFIQEITSSYRSHDLGLSMNKGFYFQERLPLIFLDLIDVRLANENHISMGEAFLLSLHYNASILARRIAFTEKKRFLRLFVTNPWLLIGFFPSIIRKIYNRIKYIWIGKSK